MRKISLPLSDALQTSLLLVLYRWRDKYYEQKDVVNSNDSGAVVALIEILNEQIQEPSDKVSIRIVKIGENDGVNLTAETNKHGVATFEFEDKVIFVKTQEPERKEPVEIECNEFDWTVLCPKCGEKLLIPLKKPAKKECEHDEVAEVRGKNLNRFVWCTKCGKEVTERLRGM